MRGRCENKVFHKTSVPRRKLYSRSDYIHWTLAQRPSVIILAYGIIVYNMASKDRSWTASCIINLVNPSLGRIIDGGGGRGLFSCFQFVSTFLPATPATDDKAEPFNAAPHWSFKRQQQILNLLQKISYLMYVMNSSVHYVMVVN